MTELSSIDSASRDPWVPRPTRILRRKQETSDTFTLWLGVGEGGAPFAPGQFNMLYVFGVGEAAISISGDPDVAAPLVHTIRAVGTVTGRMQELKRGATIGVRGPYGNGWPIAEAKGKDVLIVGGGLGIAPLRPVIYFVLRHRSLFGRVTLLFGARSPSALVFRSELEVWRRRTDITTQVIVDHAARDWTGPVGVVPALIDSVPIDASKTIAMVCGPELMMRFTARSLLRRGLSAGDVFVSLERNMKCALGFCGHCQYRETFLCRDGPVVRLDRVESIFDRREV